MPTRPLLLAFCCACAAAGVHAQIAMGSLPDGLNVDVRLFREVDDAFKRKRGQEASAYPFYRGWGVDLIYTRSLTRSLVCNISAGGWSFNNPHTATDASGSAFERRAIVMPLTAAVDLWVARGSRVNLYLQASAGYAYTQYVHRYDDLQLVETGTRPIIGLSAYLRIGIKRLPKRTTWAPLLFGTGYYRLDGSTLLSGALPFHLID